MSEPVLFLSRPATEGLALIHETVDIKEFEPVWRLFLAALLAAGAALMFATVVIFGAPGGDPGSAKGDPVHMIISPARR